MFFEYRSMIRSFAVGSGIGLTAAAILYASTPAYAAYIDWQLQHPLLLIPAALIGAAIGWLSD